MPKFAVLLLDLQKDFLDGESGRMPVDRAGADAVLGAANDILSKRVLADALPVLVVNRFPASAHFANFFRKGAAIVGSDGAEFDARLHNRETVQVISKSRPSAFSNPELNKLLLKHDVQELYVMGVFAEACVRATVTDAIKLGFSVHVLADAVASNAAWKKQVGMWAMKRAGARIMDGLPEPIAPTQPFPHSIW